MEAECIGITGLGVYLPEQRLDVGEVALQDGGGRMAYEHLGYARLPLAAAGEMPTDMATEASRRALADAGLQPADIDVIIYTGVLKDYSRWQASNKVQAALAAFNSYVFDLDQNAAGQVLALRVARDLIRHEAEVRRVLICGAERWETSLEGRLLGKSFLLGDGASAAVLERGGQGLRLLGTASATAGAWHERVCMPRLGAACTIDRNLLESKGHLLQVVRQDDDESANRRAREELQRLAREVLQEALAQGGVPLSRVVLLVISALPRPHAEGLLKAIGCPAGKSTVHYLAESGVLGGAEMFYGLWRARREGLFSPGQVLALLAVGAGLSASAALIEAGERRCLD